MRRTPHFEIFTALTRMGIECEAEYTLPATSPLSRSGYFRADLAVLVDGRPVALCECKTLARQLKPGTRQRQNYDGAGLPYIVAGYNNVDKAIKWLKEQVTR
jgi:hypothetical protein